MSKKRLQTVKRKQSTEAEPQKGPPEPQKGPTEPQKGPQRLKAPIVPKRTLATKEASHVPHRGPLETVHRGCSPKRVPQCTTEAEPQKGPTEKASQILDSVLGLLICVDIVSWLSALTVTSNLLICVDSVK